jgi:signal transduction histidine kinase
MLNAELEYIEEDPLVDALMLAAGGLIAVLNEKRQMLKLNTRLLHLLGVSDPGRVLGLRLGEVVGCVHAHEGPAGCGTTEYCSSCGAAVAQVASLAEDRPVERTCAIDLESPHHGNDQLFLRVHACPVVRGTKRVLLLFLQDITDEQKRSALDRIFFHDIKNTLCAALTASEILAQDTTRADATIAAMLMQSIRRLTREIELQQCFAANRMDRLERVEVTTAIDALLEEVARTCERHPEADGRRLVIAPLPATVPVLEIDPTLTMRVLQNMVLNAYEATPEGGVVRMWVERSNDAAEFCVWNQIAMPPEIARRVFQRNFSTKAAVGRGIGTYSMKLIGERLLGGRVTFTSEAKSGTCFRFRLPVALRRPTGP